MATNPNKYAITLEPELREEMGAICKVLGLNISGAMNVFARAFIMHGGFPFPVRIPDEYFEQECDCCRDCGCGCCDGHAEGRDLR